MCLRIEVAFPSLKRVIKEKTKIGVFIKTKKTHPKL